MLLEGLPRAPTTLLLYSTPVPQHSCSTAFLLYPRNLEHPSRSLQHSYSLSSGPTKTAVKERQKSRSSIKTAVRRSTRKPKSGTSLCLPVPSTGPSTSRRSHWERFPHFVKGLEASLAATTSHPVAPATTSRGSSGRRVPHRETRLTPRLTQRLLVTCFGRIKAGDRDASTARNKASGDNEVGTWE